MSHHKVPFLKFLPIQATLIVLMVIVFQLPQLDFIANWQDPENHVAVGIFQFFSDSISYLSIGIPILIALYFEWRKTDNLRKTRFSLLYNLLSLGLAGLVSYLVKKTFLEPRPYEVDSRIAQLSVGGGYSFPSGHTTEAFAAATALTILYYSKTKWVGMITFAWAFAVASSRVYLGVHYPFDVLAGIIIGSSVSFCLYYLVFKKWILVENDLQL